MLNKAQCMNYQAGQNLEIQILKKEVEHYVQSKNFQVGQNQNIQMLNKIVALSAICELPGGLEPGDLNAE